jgi:hypothetical protein
MSAEDFLEYVRTNNFDKANELFDQDIEFILEEDYMKNLIIGGNLEAIKYLDDLGVTIHQVWYPTYAVESNNIEMVKYFINMDNDHYYGFFNYLNALRLAEQLNYSHIIDYINTIIIY